MDLKYVTNIPDRIMLSNNIPDEPDDHTADINANRISFLFSVAANEAVRTLGLPMTIAILDTILNRLVEDEPQPQELSGPRSSHEIGNILRMIEDGEDIVDLLV